MSASRWMAVSAAGLFLAVSMPAKGIISIVDQGGGTFDSTGTTNTVGSFAVQAGDMVVMASGYNLGDQIPQAFSSAGTAELGPVSYAHQVGSGPSANTWYAEVITAGTLDVKFVVQAWGNTVGAYVIRSSTGAVKVIGSSGLAGSGSLTNHYAFGGSYTGIVVEAAGGYAGTLVTKTPGLTIDFAGSRAVASGYFTNSSLQSVWSGDGGTISLRGVAFASGNPIPPNPVRVVDKYMKDLGWTKGVTNSMGTFTAEAGDYIAILVAANVTGFASSNALFGGTAVLGTVEYQEISWGTSCHSWYVPVLTNGTVSVRMRSGAGGANCVAYQIRSKSEDEDLVVLSAKKTNGSGSSNATLTYAFGATNSGFFAEAYATYAASNGPKNPDMVLDMIGGRPVGSGFFTDEVTLINVWTNSGNMFAYVGLAFGTVPGAPKSPEAYWNAWLAGFPGMGSSTDMQDDADGDLLDNLTEYTFGGIPNDAEDQGHTPIQQMVSEGGANYMQYVYYEREDAATKRGLSYSLAVGTDLVYTNWSASGIAFVGSGASGMAGFNAVTNRISTDTENKQFLRLQIQYTP